MRDYQKIQSGKARPVGKPQKARRYSRHAEPILRFFTKHRVALAPHVRRHFPDLFGTDRTARMHLQSVAARGHLRIVRSVGMGWPNVYAITTAGLKAIGTDGLDSGNGWKRPGRMATTHLVHELLVTETAISVAEAARGRSDVEIAWEERLGFHHQAAFRSLVPDYGFLFRHTRGQLACLVEASSGEDSSIRLERKLQSYAQWSEAPDATAFLVELYRNHGARAPRPEFRLLVIAENRRGSDEARARKIVEKALALPAAMRRRIWIATVDDLLRASGIDDAVWIRCADMEARLDEWQTLPKRRQAGRLASLIRETPKRNLFPPE